MNFLTKLFKKKPAVEIPPRPSWETVVEMMYDKHLDAFSDGACKRCFVWNGQKFVIYTVKKKATKYTRIDCGEDHTIYWTQYYIAGGHGRPAAVKTPILKPCREAKAITIVVIKGKPGTINGLDEGIWVSAEKGKLPKEDQVLVLSEAAFKVLNPTTAFYSGEIIK